MITAFSIISIALSFFYLILLLYFLYGWVKAKKQMRPVTDRQVTVSVLLPVRNESANIESLIRDILDQSYPASLTEIIVIDDQSTDDTVVKVLAFDSPQIKLIRLDESEALNSYKKKAISVAIAQSDAELIIMTDGDCRVGKEWVSSIVGFYQANNLKLVSAPVSFFREKSLFERIQTIEFQFLIGVGGAAILHRKPITCNGANLAYTREVFHEVHGFEDIDDIASGDDELFLHKVAAKYPEQIGFLKDPRAIVHTYAKATLGEFIEQRKRWASNSVKYKDKGMMMWIVGLVFLFNLSLPLNLLAGFFVPVLWKTLLVQMVMKCIADGVFIYATLRFFDKRRYIFYLPIVEICYTLYILTIGLYGFMGGSYNWKGRTVR